MSAGSLPEGCRCPEGFPAVGNGVLEGLSKLSVGLGHALRDKDGVVPESAVSPPFTGDAPFHDTVEEMLLSADDKGYRCAEYLCENA